MEIIATYCRGLILIVGTLWVATWVIGKSNDEGNTVFFIVELR